MRIAIMGSGGIGGYLGGRLAAIGEDVRFIARGAHLAAMKRDGLRIESPHGDLHLPAVEATDNPADIGPVDIVVFAVKLWDTESAARALAPLIGPRTLVVTLQNGIDSAKLIAGSVPREQVVTGVIYLPSSIVRPGVIGSPGGEKRVVIDAHRGNARIAAFSQALAKAGLDSETTQTIDKVMWEKFIRLGAHSGTTTLMRTTVGPIMANPETTAFFLQLLEEGVAIAGAVGVGITPGYAAATLAMQYNVPVNVRSSMAIDLAEGRRLELPWISGRMHALGLEHGVPTPAHTAVYRGLILYANGRPA